MKTANFNAARDVALVHFALMFGYRLFSLFYPLFLAAQGFSLTQIGGAYFFIYLPIALGAPVAGLLMRFVHPALMAAAGCLGYGAYALGMAFLGGGNLVYFWQIALGLAAALFFTGERALLIEHNQNQAKQGFEWFYNAPYWAGVLSPALGALIIWRFGFTAVFEIAAAICVYAALLALGMIGYPWRFDRGSSILARFAASWNKSLKIAFSKKIGVFIILSFFVALVESLTHPFFVLFLKDDIGLTQNEVLNFTALSALSFSSFYFFVLKRRLNGDSRSAIKKGGITAGTATILFAPLMPWLSYAGVFALEFGRAVGGFLAGAGRSMLLAKELRGRPAEGSALDTIFSPLSVALGSFAGGYLIQWLGYQWLFFCAGVFLLLASIAAGCVNGQNEIK